MDTSFFPGLRILIFGHGECLLWYNFCQARTIQNLGFPPKVLVRVLARPGADLHYLSERTRAIFDFRPNVLIIHLGMHDLLRQNANPLLLADRYWHAMGLLIACMPAGNPLRVIMVGQPRGPRHCIPDRMYINRLEAFNSRLLRRAESSRVFSLAFLADMSGAAYIRDGLEGVRLRDVPIYDQPFHMCLVSLQRHTAATLIAQCK